MLCDVACLCGVLNRLCTLLHVCHSFSVFSAGIARYSPGEYLTVSTVCVHPLLCVIVKKQCHLLWNRERFLSINHMIDLFTEARCFDPKGPSSVAKEYKTNHCTT